MRIFNSNDLKSTPRADMFLPDFLKYLGFFLDASALGFLIASFATQNWWLLIGTLICGALGISAWLCWKNQTARIIGDDRFEYTTFLGKTTVYRFSDILSVRENNDSLTLILTNGKVHIESMAYMSEEFYTKVGEALERR